MEEMTEEVIEISAEHGIFDFDEIYAQIIWGRQELLERVIEAQEILNAGIAVQQMILGMIAVVGGLISALIIAVIWNGRRHK